MGEAARKDAVAYFREREHALEEVRDRLQALARA